MSFWNLEGLRASRNKRKKNKKVSDQNRRYGAASGKAGEARGIFSAASDAYGSAKDALGSARDAYSANQGRLPGLDERRTQARGALSDATNRYSSAAADRDRVGARREATAGTAGTPRETRGRYGGGSWQDWVGANPDDFSWGSGGAFGTREEAHDAIAREADYDSWEELADEAGGPGGIFDEEEIVVSEGTAGTPGDPGNVAQWEAAQAAYQAAAAGKDSAARANEAAESAYQNAIARGATLEEAKAAAQSAYGAAKQSLGTAESAYGDAQSKADAEAAALEALKNKGSHTTGAYQWEGVPLGSVGGVNLSTFGEGSTKGGLGTAGITGTYNWGGDDSPMAARRAGEYAVGDLPNAAAPSDAALAEQFGLSEKEKRLMAMFNSKGGPIGKPQYHQYGGQAKFLPVQQLQQSNPLLGTAGKIAGGAIGGALGGPLGGQAGAALGGQLGGTGTINPIAAGADVLGQNKGQVTDYLRGAIGFNKGGQVEPTYAFDGILVAAAKKLASAVGDRNKKLTGKEPEERKKSYRPEHKNMGGPIGGMAPDAGKFMSMHAPQFSEKVGPLAKTSYKSAGGEVWERTYHDPSKPKPSAGGDKKA